MLSSVDNVTIGTCNVASVILNFEEFPALDQVQSSIQFNSRQILQLINTFCIKFNRTILAVFTFCCLTVYNIPFFAANLDSSLRESFNKFLIFSVFILYDTYRIL